MKWLTVRFCKTVTATIFVCYAHKTEKANKRAFNFSKLYVQNGIIIKKVAVDFTLPSFPSPHLYLSDFHLLSHDFIDNCPQRTTITITITMMTAEATEKHQTDTDVSFSWI